MTNTEAHAVMLQGLSLGGDLQEPYFAFLAATEKWQKEHREKMEQISRKNRHLGPIRAGYAADATMRPAPQRTTFITPELLAGIEARNLR